ncbi:MAG: hypothetical protein ACRDL2_11125 [Gaiellaceae bacterium]
MLVIALIAGGMLTLAARSAVAVYHSDSAAWALEYGNEGMGLAIELVLLGLVSVVLVTMASIMYEPFRKLYLDGGWPLYLYVGVACGVAAGVAVYTVGFAPSALAKKHNVEPERMHAECRRPYLLYTPYAVVLWAALMLPVPAMMVVSIHDDHASIVSAHNAVTDDGAEAIAAASSKAPTAARNVEIFRLTYEDAVGTVQRAVGRYLWVVAVFMLFLVVILNTRITTAYADTAQEFFKWLMWVLLLAALAIVVGGVAEFQSIRQLAIGADERIVATATANGQLDVVAAADRALLQLRNETVEQFFRAAIVGGLGALAVVQGLQVLLAKITNRSVATAIFPRPVARAIHAFLLEGDETSAPRK